MGTQVIVTQLPKCDFCQLPAEYDFRTIKGYWAHGCILCWYLFRASPNLGTGNGHQLVVEQ